MTTRITALFAPFFCLLPFASAFSSMAVPLPNSGVGMSASGNVATDVAPWRVVLDIGREPLSTMPFEWARSGGRMPVKIPCDFGVTTTDNTNVKATTFVQPQSDTVSFTGPDGAVIRPIQGGKYQLNKDKTELAFDLTFPETLARRDVTIPGGTTITCTAPVYTQSAVDALYQAFYDARDAAWELGSQLNDMTSLQGLPPKVWNEATQTWERRTKKINPLQWAQKRLAYAAAKAKQEAANQQRPDPKDLSARGPFPGLDESLYVAKQGIAKTQTGAVIGTFSMEPILVDQPVSYRK